MGISTRAVMFGTVWVLALVFVASKLAGVSTDGGKLIQWTIVWALCWLTVFGLMHTAKTHNSSVLVFVSLGLGLVGFFPLIMAMGMLLK